MQHVEIMRVALEGGPCGGKSKVKRYLMNRLWKERGILSFATPEAASETKNMGFDPSKNPVMWPSFQKRLLQRMRDNEHYCETIARSYEPQPALVVIFCDRGIPGLSGYMGRDAYDKLVLSNFLCPVYTRDSHYRLVMHLVTAAYGAEEHYSSVNDEGTRTETLDEARVRDDETRLAWLGHPKMRIIPNRRGGTWEDKCEEAWRVLIHALGLPEPLEIERKFLVDTKRLDILRLPVPIVPIQVEQSYLEDGTRVRRRGQNDRWVYTKTRKTKRPGSGVYKEKERFISKAEYESFLPKRDPRTGALRKTRNYFTWADQIFELDVFDQPRGLVLLEKELIEEREPVILPPFIPIIRDVTDDKEFKNRRIAMRV